MANDASSFSPSGVKFSGGASEYSVADNGTGTSSGRPLNDNELTCAHRSLPFGTRVAITHGSHRIIAIVTDRGPYTSGRVVDLTPRGASLLGIDGVGSVSCEVVEGN
jgi:rare lipoprotein A